MTEDTPEPSPEEVNRTLATIEEQNPSLRELARRAVERYRAEHGEDVDVAGLMETRKLGERQAWDNERMKQLNARHARDFPHRSFFRRLWERLSGRW